MAPPKTSLDLDWSGDAVITKLKVFDKMTIKRLALATEAQAKTNINEPFQHADGDNRGQIDTSAMVNSTRAVFEGPNVPPGYEAAVISPQIYAPYQEEIRPFMYPAAKTVAGQAEGVALAIARGVLR